MILANGSAVQAMTLRLPGRGLWSADLVVDASSADTVTGAVTIEAGASRFFGHALRPGADPGGQVKVRVLGGAGRLVDTIGPGELVAPTVREVVQAVLVPLGERLSSSSDQAILGRALPRWNRSRGEAAGALSALCRSVGCTWRVLDDGAVWLGLDAFGALDGDFVVTSERPELGQVEVSDDAFALRPGRTVLGHRVHAVEYQVGATATRATVTTVEGGSPRQRADAAAWRRQASEAGFDFTRSYAARVTSQNDDQTVELRVDPGAPIASLSRVVLRHGFPCSEVRIVPGTEVVVSFENGDPQRPFASMPLRGTRVVLLSIDGDEFRLGGTRKVALAELTDDRFSALEDRVAALEGWGGTVSPAFSGAPGSGGSSVAAEKLSTE